MSKGTERYLSAYNKVLRTNHLELVTEIEYLKRTLKIYDTLHTRIRSKIYKMLKIKDNRRLRSELKNLWNIVRKLRDCY